MTEGAKMMFSKMVTSDQIQQVQIKYIRKILKKIARIISILAVNK